MKHLYGELDEEQIKARGFELIQEDTEWTKSGTIKSGGYSDSQDGEEIGDLTRESWEVSLIYIQYSLNLVFSSLIFNLLLYIICAEFFSQIFLSIYEKKTIKKLLLS